MIRRYSGGWLRITLLTLLGITTAFALLISYCLINPEALKPLLSYLSNTLTGRTLVIAGPIDLDVSLKPRLTARMVRFANAEWAADADMIRADFVSIQLDLVAALNKRIEILDLDVKGGQVNLEDPVDGAPNWILFTGANSDEAGEWSFMLEGMRLEDTRIDASIGDLKRISLEIPQLDETTDAAGYLHLDGHGRLNDKPWRLSSRIGTLDELLVGGRIELELDLAVGKVELEVEGSIGELATLSRMNLSLYLYGPDADLLGEILGMKDAFDGDIALTAVLQPTAAGHALDVNGNIAAFEVLAAGTVLDLNNLDGWDTRLEIHGPDAGVFEKVLQIPGLPAGPFSIRGGLHLHGGDLDLTGVDINTENVQLSLNADFTEFPRREGAFGNIHLAGTDISQFKELLRLPALPAVAFELGMTLGADPAELTANLKVGDHSLTAAGVIGELPALSGTRLVIAANGEDIAELLRLAGIESTRSGIYEAAAIVAIDDSGLSATDISFNTGPFRLSGTARLPQLTSIDGLLVNGRMAVRDLAAAASYLNIPDLPEHPISLQAIVERSANGFRLQGGNIEYRSSRASVNGYLGDLAGLAGVDVEVIVEGKNIEELLPNASSEGGGLPFILSSRVRGLERALELIGLEFSARGGDFHLDGRISLADGLAGSSFTITGKGRNLAEIIPPLPNYLPPDQPFELEARVTIPAVELLELQQSTLRIGSATLSVNGRLDITGQLKTDLQFQAAGDSLAELGQIGEALAPAIPFSISSRLNGSPNAINVSQLEARWGNSDLSAHGSLSLAEKPVVVLRGTSSLMNLVDLQRAFFGEAKDVKPEDDGEKVFPDTPIEIGSLMAFDADIDIQVDEFHGMRASLHDVGLQLKVQDGIFELQRAAYQDPFGSFNASGTLRPEGDGARLTLKVNGTDADLGLFTFPDQAPETIPRYTLDIELGGSGTTVAELVGDLDGRILISSDGGRISSAQMELFTGDFLSNVLAVLNPFAANDAFTPMECMVINATLLEGKLQLEPGFVMRTDRVNMYVYGGADLKTERLDLSLATQARRGLGISAASITNPYFKIGGTFVSPALQLDPGSAAVAASLATATAGLSIVIRGFLDRLMGQRNPCPKFLNYHEADG